MMPQINQAIKITKVVDRQKVLEAYQTPVDLRFKSDEYIFSPIHSRSSRLSLADHSGISFLSLAIYENDDLVNQHPQINKDLLSVNKFTIAISFSIVAMAGKSSHEMQRSE
jgi:hypothetical protein